MRTSAKRVILTCVTLNFLGVLACTLYGGLHSDKDWETISEMVARNDRLRHGFVGYVFLSTLLILAVVYTVIMRLEGIGGKLHGWVYLVWVTYAIAMGSYLGAAIESTDIDTDMHTSLSVAAFVGLLTLAALVVFLQWSHARFRWLSVTVLLCAIASGLMYPITSDYYWEYVLVTLLHIIWLLQAFVNGEYDRHGEWILRNEGVNWNL